jgi:hypothetical protein
MTGSNRTLVIALISTILISGCSVIDASYEMVQRAHDCPGWTPRDRTCDGSRPPEYRSDSLGDGGYVIIK